MADRNQALPRLSAVGNAAGGSAAGGSAAGGNPAVGDALTAPGPQELEAWSTPVLIGLNAAAGTDSGTTPGVEDATVGTKIAGS